MSLSACLLLRAGLLAGLRAGLLAGLHAGLRAGLHAVTATMKGTHSMHIAIRCILLQGTLTTGEDIRIHT